MGTERKDFNYLTTSGESCLASLSRLYMISGESTVNPEWILVDAVTAVEVHVDRTIESLVADSGISSIPIGRAFLSRYAEDMSRTWDARYQWLADGFGVKVGIEKIRQDFQVLVECRNAIVHGSGHLTRRQQSGLGKFIQLRKQLKSVLDVGVHGTVIVFSRDSAQFSLRVASSFVHGFDRTVLESSHQQGSQV
ncbi:hypothetical protein PV367_29960 [Streptomyces europaeiscabiei]|uniref:RiboL-PSP-HEPN domain-containing protein n=1 Tax=Streptomyces europaeiscabiei TaxID=146819 RepID=A0AAJ2PV17_9ACTN|nr:hypothetical protein [Streptomyces europaeiscabiei]MDX3133914.1 hypothetical protein [Streptomyces europaeiscabiei]